MQFLLRSIIEKLLTALIKSAAQILIS